MARYDNRREYKKDLYRRNHNIRVPEVRVIDTDGSMLGIMSVAQAVSLAKERELDLVEISPNANPQKSQRGKEKTSQGNPKRTAY